MHKVAWHRSLLYPWPGVDRRPASGGVDVTRRCDVDQAPRGPLARRTHLTGRRARSARSEHTARVRPLWGALESAEARRHDTTHGKAPPGRGAPSRPRVTPRPWECSTRLKPSECSGPAKCALRLAGGRASTKTDRCSMSNAARPSPRARSAVETSVGDTFANESAQHRAHGHSRVSERWTLAVT
jgi:hypothetical protein